MTAEDRLNDFLSKVNQYIDSKFLAPKEFDQECLASDNLSVGELNDMSRDDCFSHAYKLYQYADHLASERANQENVCRWCDLSLNSIMAQEIDNSMIAKYEIKAARVILENELAATITKWKQHAESRLAKLSSREYNVRKKADILFEKGKRK
jgi:hypothetical protein